MNQNKREKDPSLYEPPNNSVLKRGMESFKRAQLATSQEKPSNRETEAVVETPKGHDIVFKDIENIKKDLEDSYAKPEQERERARQPNELPEKLEYKKGGTKEAKGKKIIPVIVSLLSGLGLLGGIGATRSVGQEASGKTTAEKGLGESELSREVDRRMKAVESFLQMKGQKEALQRISGLINFRGREVDEGHMKEFIKEGIKSENIARIFDSYNWLSIIYAENSQANTAIGYDVQCVLDNARGISEEDRKQALKVIGQAQENNKQEKNQDQRKRLNTILRKAQEMGARSDLLFKRGLKEESDRLYKEARNLMEPIMFAMDRDGDLDLKGEVAINNLPDDLKRVVGEVPLFRFDKDVQKLRGGLPWRDNFETLLEDEMIRRKAKTSSGNRLLKYTGEEYKRRSEEYQKWSKELDRRWESEKAERLRRIRLGPNYNRIQEENYRNTREFRLKNDN